MILLSAVMQTWCERGHKNELKGSIVNKRKLYSSLGKTFNFIGIMLMVAVIAATIPLTVPKLFGIQIFSVLTGSMEPAYPVGSVLYIQEVSASDVVVGDAVTYSLGDESEYVMTHRVIEIRDEEQVFFTQGDANEIADEVPVSFSRLIGKPVLCIPKLAVVSDFIHTTSGKAAIFCMFAVAFILWLIADLMKKRRIINDSDKAADLIDDRDYVGKSEERPSWNKKQLSGRQLIRGIAAVAIILSAICLIYIALDYRKADMEYEKLQAYVTTKKAEDTKPVNEDTKDATSTQEVFQPDMEIITKLGELREMNTDVTGWIAFDRLKISYPLMHPEDNLYYLTHTFSRTENKAGSIFMDAGNSANMTDFHTIIYGHNMKNGSMFGLLKRYYDEAFYEGNEYFTIYTDDKAYRYEIFSAHTVAESDEIYTIWYTPDENNVEYGSYLERMKCTSWYDTGVEILNSDKVVTLSTCTASDDKRFVVHGKLIAMYVTE